MAHGKNASLKVNRNREKNGAKGWFKTYKQKRYMTDAEAITLDINANGGLETIDTNQIHYVEDATSYVNGLYDQDIYGYDRREKNPVINTKRRHISSVAVAKMVA